MAEVTTEYSVDITTAPLPEGIGDIEALVDAVAFEVYRTDLAASVGGDLADRTIGITATVDAPSHLAAAEIVLEVFGEACRRAGLVEGDQLQQLFGAINVTPAAILPAA
jgi:hypothetical protein